MHVRDRKSRRGPPAEPTTPSSGAALLRDALDDGLTLGATHERGEPFACGGRSRRAKPAKPQNAGHRLDAPIAKALLLFGLLGERFVDARLRVFVAADEQRVATSPHRFDRGLFDRPFASDRF